MTDAWLVASPGTGIFARQTALAFDEVGRLDGFLVPFADRPESGLQRMLVRLARVAGADLGPTLARRAVPELSAEMVRTRPLPEVVRAAVERIDRTGIWTDRAWDWAIHRFVSASARALRSRAVSLYAYEYAALEAFELQRRARRRCVLEVNSLDALETMERSAAYARLDPVRDTPYQRHLRRLAPKRAIRRAREWELADRVVVNSQATLDSMARAGRDVRKAVVVPLGAPDVPELPASPARSSPTRLLWAGNFSLHKGADVLSRALGQTGAEFQLDIRGRCSHPIPPDPRLRALPMVPQADLFRAFAGYDALVLPTTSDGFAMVITEALAHGLPVLTTTAAGAASFVEDGVNGWTIPPDDAGALARAIEKVVATGPAREGMRRAAHGSMRGHGWRQYRQALRDAVLG